MWANLSFDWRKCQFLFDISAINVVCGLNFVTRGMRLIDTLSLASRLSSFVSERTFLISVNILPLSFVAAGDKKTVNIPLFSA